MRAWIVAVVALAFAKTGWSQENASSSATLGEVVVTGEQPGPKLWKLTKGGHTLWILGTVTPKPSDITWKSLEVAGVLDHTQEVIDQQLQGRQWSANVELDVKSFNPLAGLKAVRGAKKLQASLPAQLPLRQSVTADAYERFSKLKSVYLPKDTSIESQPPMVAASRLYGAAIAAQGLSTRAMIHEEVHKLARQRRVKVSDVRKTYQFDLETMIQVNFEFAKVPADLELACFIETLDQIESNLPTMTERANAWAKGDIEKLRKLRPDRRYACDRAQWHAPRWSNLDRELDNFWLDTIEAAVANNESTLVMLDMVELLEQDGLLPMLGGRGFEIEEPL